MNTRDMPVQGSERETLLACLDNQRAIVHWKVRGLTTNQGWESHVPSASTLLGLVKHLALVERYWFVEQFGGGSVQHDYDFDSDPDAEFRRHPDDTAESVLADYERAVAESNNAIAAASFDDVSAKPRRNGETPSLRWVVVHMIEETARHAGHVDILRELTDELTGYIPTS